MVVIIVDVGHAIAFANGDVTDDACLRRGHAVVLQLDLLLVDLRVQRREPRLGGTQRVLCLFELLPADRPRRHQRFEPLHLLTPVLHVCLDAGAAGFGAAHRRLLLVRLDLDDGRAERHTITRLDEDAGDHAVDFRLDGRRSQRSDGRDESGRLLDRLLLERDRGHAHWRRRSAPPRPAHLPREHAVAPASSRVDERPLQVGVVE